jgi:hypothetical protein
MGALTEHEDVKCSCYSGEWNLYQEAPSELDRMIYTTGLATHGHHLVISRRFNTNNGSVVYVRLPIMVSRSWLHWTIADCTSSAHPSSPSNCCHQQPSGQLVAKVFWCNLRFITRFICYSAFTSCSMRYIQICL